MTDRPRRLGRVLLHPWWVLALVLLLVNDHLLKGAEILPSALTGKLSDVAGMLVAPAVLALLLRVRDRRGLIACHVAVGAGFAAINLVPPLARGVEAVTAMVGLPWRIWCDPTDLIALPLLVLSERLIRRAAQADRSVITLWSVAAERGLFAMALLACMATSRAPPARVGASPEQVHVPLGYSAEEIALIDAATGREVQQLKTSLSSAPRPARIGNVLVGWEGYGGEGKGRLVGIDLTSGALRFAHDLGYGHAPILVAGEMALVAYQPNEGGTQLASLDAATGQIRWQRPLAGSGRLYLAGDLLLVGEDERVSRLDVATGAARWTVTLHEDVVALTSLGDSAYLHLDDGSVQRHALSNGALRERRALPSRTQRAHLVHDGSLVASDRALYVLIDDGVMVLDESLRRRRVLPEITGLYAESGVVLGLRGHVVRRLSPVNGDPMWRYEGADFWFDGATIVAGTIYLGGDEHVVAVDADSGRERWRWTYPDER